MSRAVVMMAAVVATGCYSFPVADVRHAHARAHLVSGARALAADAATDDYMEQMTGFSHIAAGDRVVLVVLDCDAREGWTDSGTGETLIVEIPALRRGAEWAIGEGSRVWFYRISAWGVGVVGNLCGTISVREQGASWAIDVELTGMCVRNGRDPNEARLRHTFIAAPRPFEQFKRDFPPATGWTR